MPRTVLRSLWTEPRPADPLRRVWQDRALLVVLLTWSVLEALAVDLGMLIVADVTRIVVADEAVGAVA